MRRHESYRKLLHDEPIQSCALILRTAMAMSQKLRFGDNLHFETNVPRRKSLLSQLRHGRNVPGSESPPLRQINFARICKGFNHFNGGKFRAI